ncbi:NAD-dependent deacylase [Zavarzinella formosa]|uniref:NAD-dependent deacylase n=1 Tax=Zavarzinella formosa TaxID=360055 RepID=UPI0012F9D4EB|nr:NAD-dependent deacylase [Zavarzinella formosa]
MNEQSPAPELIRRAAAMLATSKRVAVLTGAGVSAESGVPTFRASDGLWEGHRIEEVATPEGYARNPELVWTFYNARRANVATVKPNPGHEALATLENHFGDNFTIITQNVDGLHQQAGSKNVLEVHGSLRRTRCVNCGQIADRGLEVLSNRPECQSCGRAVRPDIVWFGETLPPDIWRKAQEAAEECDTLIVVGTSAVVYPAAGLIGMVKRRIEWGSRPAGDVIEVNIQPSEAASHADVGIYAPSGVVLPLIVEKFRELTGGSRK